MLTRIAVLMVLSGLVPLTLVGLAAWNDPDALDDHVRAAVLSLVVLVGTYVGWAAWDGYHGWFGQQGPQVWAVIAIASPLVPMLLWTISLGGAVWGEMIATFVVLAGVLALLTMGSWMAGHALSGGPSEGADGLS